MRIALAGNPNSGKTSMYNMLTGKSEKVGNWAGVTVDKKENFMKKQYGGGEDLIAVDLPGAYSMSPFTSEESITSEYVKNEALDVIINIVDATNLSRSLFFTTQLMELGIPVVVALNKSDVNAKKENVIDVAKLSEKLGCPVVSTVSTAKNNNGLTELIKTVIAVKGTAQMAPYSQKVVFEIIDSKEKMYGVSDQLARNLCEKLQDDELLDRSPDKQKILSYIDMVTKYIQQHYITSKQELIQKNKDKLSNWLMLRKEEYVLKAKDSSELDAIKEQYAAETDFRQKIALKKHMESLEQQQKQMIEAFHDEMTSLEVEANEMQKEFEDRVLRTPQFIPKIVIKF